jgi:hypothetical protein
VTAATRGREARGRGAAGPGVAVGIPEGAPSNHEARRWARVLGWLDRGIRLGLVAYGVVHLLIGWLGLQLAFGDSTERPSSTGAMQELARQPFGEVVVLAIVGGLFVLVVWRLLELSVGHRDKAPGVDRWRARAVSGFKGLVYAALCLTALGVAVHARSSAGGSTWTRTVRDWPAGPWVIGVVAIVTIAYGANHARRGFAERHAEHLSGHGRSGETGFAYVALGKIGYVGKGIAIAVVGGLMLVGALTHDPSQSGNLDHALRTLLSFPFGRGLVVLIAAGLLCFGVFCLARARHLSRAHVRTTSPVSPSKVSRASAADEGRGVDVRS